ncbi:putative O-glycosylation ligase, exosortase A system-associated [Parvularcula sp. LCG005]|uniref:putative O-glycosylation ligase, exosortase A system-associated n=1 Tax=Parvularcula sp. LCG005 TaxID=3078805 RepID=UPI002942FEE8|nr:putative O-glycosylation ligase, exosortase A system-associated [Parvularcula sp. LCG005]WOI54499.1 putative O-glycosylation ligase, exosortase A system-associated [Parvularcula sp. LCG005]
MRDLVLLVFLAAALLSLIRYPFVGLLVWAWFSLATPQAASYWASQYPLNMYIAVLTVIAFFFHGEFWRARLSGISWLMVGFAVWLWMSQLNSIAPGISAYPFDLFFKVMIFALLCSAVVTTRLRFHALLWLFALVMGFFGAKAGAYTLATLGRGQVFGIDGTVLYDNNHMGIALATTLPVFLYLARQAVMPITRYGIWAVFGLSIIGIIGTQSRGAFIALIVFAGLMWLRSSYKVITGALAVVVAIIGVQFLPDDYTDRMSTITEADEDASFMGRVEAWETNWELAKRNPLTGAGLRVAYEQDIADTVTGHTARAAHSIYFEVLGGTGFIGLLFYLGFIGLAFLKAGQAERRYASTGEGSWRSPFGKYAQMAIITFGIGGASVSMEMWDGYLIIIALISALGRVEGNDKPAAPGRFTDRLHRPQAATARERIRARAPSVADKSVVKENQI